MSLIDDLIGKYVQVHDKYRGIYVGVLAERRAATEEVYLLEKRHCYGWVLDDPLHRGVYSLAIVGPGHGSRVGKPVDGGLVCGVAKIIPCTPAAEKAWRGATWRE